MKPITLENYKNPRLKPAIHVRPVVVKACGSCKHSIIINGFFCCKREGGYECDAGDGKQWEMVCSGWQNCN